MRSDDPEDPDDDPENEGHDDGEGEGGESDGGESTTSSGPQLSQLTEDVMMVAFQEELVTVKWTQPNGKHREEHALKNCTDPAQQAFVDAFRSLDEQALKILRIRDKSWALARVTKLRIQRNNEGRRWFHLTIGQDLEDGRVVFALPGRQEREDAKDTAASFATDELRNAVLRVCAEALAYAKGQRVQLDLFPKGENTEGGPLDPNPEAVATARPEAMKAAAKRNAKKRARKVVPMRKKKK